MLKRVLLAATVFGGLSLTAPAAFASTTSSGVLTVEASIDAACSITDATLNFGEVVQVGTNTAAATTAGATSPTATTSASTLSTLNTTSVSPVVTCTGGPISVNLAIGSGGNSGADTTASGDRAMVGANTAGYLGYSLKYAVSNPGVTNAGEAIPTSDTVGTTLILSSGTATPVIDGTITGTGTTADDYSDTVIMTLTY